MKKSILFSFLLFLSVAARPQFSPQPNASKIKMKLLKLNFLGSALYLAAHPDDENTRVIAFLAQERHAETAYLALTRGDGGQNLIGSEIRDELGAIRTQELQAARRVDGGKQFFSRANDFGFSKSADEAFALWGKDEILSDVVLTYRKFQPDVIITRFPPDSRAGHGHHTASALLAIEAFDKAALPNFLPEQVKQYGIWKPTRLLTNTGRWWNKEINENTKGVLKMDVGSYNPLLGESYGELSARSRSSHKSQGFGSAGSRGEYLEFFENVKGEPAATDVFEKVNTTWSRIKGGDKIQPLVTKVMDHFNYEKPYLSIPQLFEIRKKIEALDNSVWKERKWNEVNELIADCSGLFVEGTASQYYVAPGENVKLSVEVVNRSPVEMKLTELKSEALKLDSTCQHVLSNNKLTTFIFKKEVNKNADYSAPYWLRTPHSTGLFQVENKSWTGLPENPAAINVTADFLVMGQPLQMQVPVRYKWTDPVKGGLYRPLEITPPVFVNIETASLLFKDTNPIDIRVKVKSAKDNVQGQLKLTLPSPWKAGPSQDFLLAKAGDEMYFSFLITPPEEESIASIKAMAEVDGKTYSQALKSIPYDHIPTITLLTPSTLKAVRVNVLKKGKTIGYIKGAGDEVPGALRTIGYDVWEMKNNEITLANLQKNDAVVLGIRTLNANDDVRFFMPAVLAYIKQGGTVIVQYNTTPVSLDWDKFSPYSITVSRDRITEEDSEVQILKPESPVLNTPNKISADDFKNWVQERGLYYPSAWDSHFEALLSGHDKGEKPLDGGLLVAHYGKGYYIYTSLSFFRQLPEGVPGAYKLLANLVSLGK